MPTIVKDIINDVISQLSMVGSFSTQVYAAPRIQQHVQDATILLMDEEWWPHLCKYITVTLDGVTGKPTSDLVIPGYDNHSFSRFQDIEFVMLAGSEQRLLRLPTNINPYNIGGAGGFATAQFIEPDISNPLRPFTIWPQASVDTLVIRARLYPTIPISSTDTVYLDRLMLTYAAAWMYATDDGTNPGAIDKFEKLMEKRVMQVKKGFEEHRVPISGPSYAGTGQWQEEPW